MWVSIFWESIWASDLNYCSRMKIRCLIINHLFKYILIQISYLAVLFDSAFWDSTPIQKIKSKKVIVKNIKDRSAGKSILNVLVIQHERPWMYHIYVIFGSVPILAVFEICWRKVAADIENFQSANFTSI